MSDWPEFLKEQLGLDRIEFTIKSVGLGRILFESVRIVWNSIKLY